MTDNEIVHITLRYLRPQDKRGHIEVVNTLWKHMDLSPEKNQEILAILLDKKWVNNSYDGWKLQLTELGRLAPSHRFIDDHEYACFEILKYLNEFVEETNSTDEEIRKGFYVSDLQYVQSRDQLIKDGLIQRRVENANNVAWQITRPGQKKYGEMVTAIDKIKNYRLPSFSEGKKSFSERVKDFKAKNWILYGILIFITVKFFDIFFPKFIDKFQEEPTKKDTSQIQTLAKTQAGFDTSRLSILKDSLVIKSNIDTTKQK